LSFGGYPRIVIEDQKIEKQRLINEIYQSYIERDISYLLNVKKTEAFSNLVKILAAQIGRLVNLSELSSTLGISIKTVKDYLWYLEKTFIIKRVTPYFRNIRKEISKSSIFYFYDIGLRNFASGNYGNPNDMGFVFQNFIFNILYEKTRISPSSICFWRTKDKAEVDFVIDTGKKPMPVEAKYKKLKAPEIPKAMRSFVAKYKPEKALIVNLTLDETAILDRTKICIIPFYKILENPLLE
jgi:hypothetical protein